MSTTPRPPTSLDYPRSAGGAAIGARLRRLSERIDREASSLYADLGVDFEQRWFGIVDRLARQGPMTVGELSAVLGVTHAAISQTRSALEARGLVDAAPDPADGRRRVLSLTAEGRDLVARLRPVWKVLDQVAEELNAEAGDAVVVLDRLEAALTRESLQARAQGRLAD